MRRTPAKLLQPFLRLFVRYYFSKARAYRYKDIRIQVFPTVFFPHFTISTKMLLQFLEGHDLREKRFLELGCGSGIISVLAAKKGAKVTASDLNPKAVENAAANAERNHVHIESIRSDLFSDIPKEPFDYIIINPPYYPKTPQNNAEAAWYCGEEHEYFQALFLQLLSFVKPNSHLYMILSEDCDLERIQSLAAQNRFQFEEVKRKQQYGEWTFIYRITQT